MYGDPYERDGVVVIPAASVRGLGGGGGGEGSQPERWTRLWLGARARLQGTSRRGLRDPRQMAVEWKPAVDTTSIALRAQAGLIVLLLLLLLRRR